MDISTISRPLLTKALGAYQDHKRNQILEKLSSSEIKLDDAKLKSDAFISAFIKTEESIQKAESQEKLDFLLSLYISGIKSEQIFDNPDRYHEVIHTLGEMSHREISFLYILDEYCRSNEETTDNFREFNNGLSALLQEKLNLNYSDQEAMTRRLYRTGFVSSKTTVDGGLWPRISSLYKDVLDFIHYNWDNSRLLLEKA